MNTKSIQEQAKKELKEEAFRRAVDTYKIKFKNHRPFWYKLFPFRVIVTRR